eukprot:gnl/Spiro4/5918_TR3028_c0_g1_i1.p1 gnl/Spiro4/5918_TR3028_c0_g1~~gnl/Spiro4/5918_TR3028_c0_g1_i1.p1  ORF type:complete len:228 (+),score=31.53 gnl/Spiro4/5918_TR3028_c0_g1_i1:40-684(+)
MAERPRWLLFAAVAIVLVLAMVSPADARRKTLHRHHRRMYGLGADMAALQYVCQAKAEILAEKHGYSLCEGCNSAESVSSKAILKRAISDGQDPQSTEQLLKELGELTCAYSAVVVFSSPTMMCVPAEESERTKSDCTNFKDQMSSECCVAEHTLHTNRCYRSDDECKGTDSRTFGGKSNFVDSVDSPACCPSTDECTKSAPCECGNCRAYQRK